MSRPAVQQWSDTEGLRFFCRHLIGLCVTYNYKDRKEDERSRFAAYSGTLIKIDDSVHFLTAGHILRGLEANLRSDQIEITSAVLADTFGRERISDQPIPFDLKSARFFYVDDDGEGLDFGLMHLTPYYVRLLARNGVVALEESHWIQQPNLEFDAYAMLGLPDEFASERVSHSGDGQVSPTMFRVHRLATPPSDRPPTRHPQFVGQLDKELPIQSIVGMSGGPIFGFKKTRDETRYWIVALQSSWLPDRRIVFGCLLPVLASLITDWAKGLNEASQ